MNNVGLEIIVVWNFIDRMEFSSEMMCVQKFYFFLLFECLFYDSLYVTSPQYNLSWNILNKLVHYYHGNRFRWKWMQFSFTEDHFRNIFNLSLTHQLKGREAEKRFLFYKSLNDYQHTIIKYCSVCMLFGCIPTSCNSFV